MGNRRRRNKDTCMKPTKFIPDDILKLIFVKLSLADVKAASQTCKQWKKIISGDDFKAKLYFHSKPSFLVEVRASRIIWKGYKSMTLEFDPEEKLGFESFKLKPYSIVEKNHIARSVCNGLILASDNEGDLFVMNTATKRGLTLPKCPSGCLHEYCSGTLLFCPNEKAYKVIHISKEKYGFEILTIGFSRNEWRVVLCPFREGLGPKERMMMFWSEPLITDKHMSLHWEVDTHEFMLSMDVRNESFRKTSLPSYYNSFFDRILEIGDNLGIVHQASETRYEVSVLRDPLARNWEPLYSVEAKEIAISSDLNPLPNFTSLYPIFSLRDGNVIIFEHTRTNWWYFYEAKLRKMKKVLKLDSHADMRLLLSKPSLFHWNNAKEEIVPN